MLIIVSLCFLTPRIIVYDPQDQLGHNIRTAYFSSDFPATRVETSEDMACFFVFVVLRMRGF